jgi:transcriptional regulator with PAS, ATPase and Fis domain
MGDFREDLYYRINVFQIEIPPLRKRKEDIPYLCDLILDKLNLLYKKEINNIGHEVLSIFHNYYWPGNVRELENIIERAYILEKSSELSVINIPKELIPATKELLSISPLNRHCIGLAEARKESTASFEKRYLTELLIAHSGKVTNMAEEAEVTVRQLHKLMAKHEIKSSQFSINLEIEETKSLPNLMS